MDIVVNPGPWQENRLRTMRLRKCGINCPLFNVHCLLMNNADRIYMNLIYSSFIRKHPFKLVPLNHQQHSSHGFILRAYT